MSNVATGLSTTLLACDESGVIGYATVHRNNAPWTRSVGELRVNVAPKVRARARPQPHVADLRHRTRPRPAHTDGEHDDGPARRAGRVRRLGFVPEALLADYVEDRNGRPRALVMMSYDIHGHSDVVAEPLRLQ